MWLPAAIRADLKQKKFVKLDSKVYILIKSNLSSGSIFQKIKKIFELDSKVYILIKNNLSSGSGTTAYPSLHPPALLHLEKPVVITQLEPKA